MAEFRRKSSTIEAHLFDGSPESGTRIIDWILANGGTASYHEHLMDGGFIAHPNPFLRIRTQDSCTIASLNDWVIKDADNGFYACNPTVFWRAYEEVL